MTNVKHFIINSLLCFFFFYFQNQLKTTKMNLKMSIIQLILINIVNALDVIHRVGNVKVYNQATFQEFQFQTKIVIKFDFEPIKGFIKFADKFLPMLKDDKYEYLYNLVIDLSHKLTLIAQMNSELDVEPRAEPFSPTCVIAYRSFNNYDLKRYIDTFDNKKKEYAGKVINQDTTAKEIERFEMYMASLIQTADKLHLDIVKMNRINGELILGKIPYEIQPILFHDDCWVGPHSPIKVEKADCFIKSATDTVAALACNYLIRLDEYPEEYHKYIAVPFANISLSEKELYSLPEKGNQLFTIDCETNLNNERVCDINEYDDKCTEALRSQNIMDLEYYCHFIPEKQSLPYFVDESLILFDPYCEVSYNVGNTNETENITIDLSNRNFPVLIKGGYSVTANCQKGKYIYNMAKKEIEIQDFSLSPEQQNRLKDMINETIAVYSSITGFSIILISSLSVLTVIIIKLRGKISSKDKKIYRPMIRRRKSKDRETKQIGKTIE